MAKKVHHAPDYAKDKTADVIKKGSSPTVPNEQWEMNRDITPHGESNGWGAFLPRTGKSRPTPHTKINECDH
jgi:hypothetical protein